MNYRTHKNTLDDYILWVVLFLSFFGYYALLLLLFNFDLYRFSRSITVPVRIATNILIGIWFIRNYKLIRVRWQLLVFLLFISIYLFRIIIDFNNGRSLYTTYDILLYHLFLFSVIPFIFFSSLNLRTIKYKVIVNSFFTSGLIFSLICILVYGRFFGRVSRLGTGKDTADAVINPLTLSYCAALIIVGTIFYLLHNKSSKFIKIISIVSIILALVPLYLGASRGSVFAIIIPFLIMFFSETRISFQTKVKRSLYLIIFVALLVYLDRLSGSGLLDRVLSTQSDIEQGNSEAIRLTIWKTAWNQFMNNPFFGDKLQVGNQYYYAHNILIEVLQSLGIIGFVPFIILIINSMKITLNIFKNHKRYIWISVIFIQAFVQHLFSGNLATAIWFWVSMGILIGLDRSFGRFRNKKNESKVQLRFFAEELTKR